MPMRLLAISGIRLAAAWPCCVRCQCSRESSGGAGGGSLPMAVGYSSSSAPMQRHDARALGKPLIPADADAEPAVTRMPDPKPGVARAEIELLLIARAVRDMRLAVDAESPAVGIEHRQRIEIDIAGALEEADRQHHRELGRQGAEAAQQRAVIGALSQLQMPCILFDTEVWRRKQLLQQDDLRRRAACAVAHQALGALEIRGRSQPQANCVAATVTTRGRLAHASASAGAPCAPLTRSVISMAVRSARKPSSPLTSTAPLAADSSQEG